MPTCILGRPPIGATAMSPPPEIVNEETDECCPDIAINNWDEMPQGIEISSQPLFCVLDADDNILGRTFLCKVVDEKTGAESFTKMVAMIGAAEPVLYDAAIHGAESVCSPKDDCEVTTSGLIGWG